MPSVSESLLREIHAAPSRGVFFVTGGGSQAISQLLQVPGASQTVLDARVPYSYMALQQCVGGQLDSACSERAARALAMAALEQAHQLDPSEPEQLFGIGATASLASDRPKRGEHRVHVSLQTRRASMVWNLRLAKNQRTRTEEEAIAASLVLHAAAVAADVVKQNAWLAETCDQLTSRKQASVPLWQSILWGETPAALIDPSDDVAIQAADQSPPKILYPGSFDPPHVGHQQLVDIAKQKLGHQVDLELSLTNVDKPRLDYLGLNDRLQTIGGEFPDATVWLTQTPTFLEKARQFPGVTFLVGADTLTRIVDPKYYGNDPAGRDTALTQLAEQEARFLVFGRQIGQQFVTLADLTLPPTLESRCQGVSAEEFREDISSTQLRSER